MALKQVVDRLQALVGGAAEHAGQLAPAGRLEHSAGRSPAPGDRLSRPARPVGGDFQSIKSGLLN